MKKLKEDYDDARRKSESMRSELGALKEARARQEGKLNELVDSLERVVKEGESLEGKKKEYEKLVSFLKTLDDIRKLFDKSGIQLELRKRAVPAIEKHMLEFFREFNFEYSDISLSEDYEVTLFGPGGETGGRMISGGERIAVALALRLAIAKALAGSSAESVMLDEPTIFLDEQRRQDLVEVFKKLTVIPQMIVVTHDTAMEEAADNITMIIKNRGVSSVKNE